MKTVISRLTFCVSNGIIISKQNMVPDMQQMSSHDLYDLVGLPKNRSRIGVGNTWNDNRFFQPNGYVLDFVVHYGRH